MILLSSLLALPPPPLLEEGARRVFNGIEEVVDWGADSWNWPVPSPRRTVSKGSPLETRRDEFIELACTAAIKGFIGRVVDSGGVSKGSWWGSEGCLMLSSCLAADGDEDA